MKQLQIFDFAMVAGGSFQLPVSGSYFRILTATGNVSVIGDTFGKLGPINRGQGLENSNYNRLVIKDESGSANAGTILVSESNFIDQTLYGSISLTGAVTLDAATLLALEQVNVRPEASTGNYKAQGAIAAGAPDTIFTPASNANGAILLSAHSSSWGTNPSGFAFIAKASAPASNVDGEIFLGAGAVATQASAQYGDAGILHSPQFVAAGLGLYYITFTAASPCHRAARFKLL